MYIEYSILKRRERELCEYIMHITLMTETLISIAAPTGTALESLIKFLTRTFSVLTAFTKYFTLRSTCAEPIYQNALYATTMNYKYLYTFLEYFIF